MNALRLRAAIVLALAVAAAAAAHAWRPTKFLADTRTKVDLEQMFPAQMGTWTIDKSGPVQLVSPDQKALLNKLYSQTLTRTYINPTGERVMLSVAYGGDQSDATTAHRPEVCYPAQGFEILSSGKSVVPLVDRRLPVLHMLAKLGGRIEPVSYWFVVGEHVALSGTDQKLAQLRYSARGVVPDGLLMRVSTIDPDAPRAYSVQADFVGALYGAVAPVWRSRVFGMEAVPSTNAANGPQSLRG